MSECSTCSTSSGGTSGCQNNGTCGTSDCNKMNSFDWLTHMGIPDVDNFDIIEIKFKGGRKEYYRNVNLLSLNTGDPVVVDVANGHHIGYVSLQGELVRLQMQKRKIRDDDNILKIYRIANQNDLEKWVTAQNREMPSLYRCRQIVEELGLKMKMSDIEYQADNSKATFYYSADDRIDFRELIKLLAGEFRIRVEMRQISLRQEAGRIGGIGVCGRELCCSTWLVDFKNVSTSAARYQNLSLNPSKLSGQCGRLKCCLNYELDTYMEAIKDIPNVEAPLLTEAGQAKLQKTDIFRKMMWFSYNNDNNWQNISCERVKEIQKLNAKGIKVVNLQFNESSEMEDLAAKSTRELEILDKKFANPSTKRKKKPKSRNKNQDQNPNLPRPQSAGIPAPRQEAKEQGGQQPADKKKKPNRSRNKNRNPNTEQGVKGNQANDQAKEKPTTKGSKFPKDPGATTPAAPKPSGNTKKKFPPRKNQGPNPNKPQND